MDVDLSDEQIALAEASRQLLTREWTTADVRAAARPDGPGHSANLWKRIADAGWLSVAFPESMGGDGGSLMDLGVIVQEAGRALVPTTFTSTLYAGFLLAELGTKDDIERWLRPMIGGEALATVAYAEPSAVHDPSVYQTVVRRAADGWRLTGRKSFVENASLSNLIIVTCRAEPGQGEGSLRLCLVRGDHLAVDYHHQATFGHDLQDEVILTDVQLDRADLLGWENQGTPDRWRHVTDVITALTSLEMVGGARAVIDHTVEYLKERHAFGKPIGSFQAVQHLMANAAMAVKGAELASWQAVWRLSAGRPAARETAIAKASAGRAYRETTVVAHQVWGGMGYTEESDLHLWSRRAVAADLRYGSAAFQIRRLANQLQR